MKLTKEDLTEVYEVPPDVQVWYRVDVWREPAPLGVTKEDMVKRVLALAADYPGCNVCAVREDNGRKVCIPPY